MMAKTSPLATLVSMIFPIDCVICQKESNWFCAECLKTYQKIRLTSCFICAKAADAGICPACQSKTGLDGIVSILPYRQKEVRQLIKNAKYHGAHNALAFIVKTMRPKILRLLPEQVETVTFVPTTKAKEKERGYNPALVVAETLAEDGLTVADIFVKTKDGPSQTGLTKAKRQTNVRRAFQLKSRELPETLVIADDVVTTGATLGALAKLAKKRGAKTVWAVTICHG